MKHILTITLCFLALSLSAQTEYPYPYNPDGNNDGLISLNDLMDLLALYGLEYNAGVLATDSISAIYYTGEMDYWDCASSCVALRGNWKILDYNLVGSYKEVLFDASDPLALVSGGGGKWTWIDHVTSNMRLDEGNIAIGGWDNFTNCVVCGFPWTGEVEAAVLQTQNYNYNSKNNCFCQTRTRADIEDINLCEGLEDECGVCNGEGAIYECGCADIPEGDCDCNGNQLDAVGVCGGDCLEDSDGDGECDLSNSINAISTLGNSMPTMISNESANTMTFAVAMLYCDNLSELGYSDWMLPTLEQISFAASGGSVFNDLRNDSQIWTRTQAVTGSGHKNETYTINLGLNPNAVYRFEYTSSSTLFNCRCVR
jgi:hypothetical protein